MDDNTNDMVPSATVISLFNGIMSLAVTLARRGLLNEDDVQSLTDYMARPLDYPNAAEAPDVANFQKQIEVLTAELLHQIRKNPDVTSD